MQKLYCNFVFDRRFLMQCVAYYKKCKKKGKKWRGLLRKGTHKHMVITDIFLNHCEHTAKMASHESFEKCHQEVARQEGVEGMEGKWNGNYLRLTRTDMSWHSQRTFSIRREQMYVNTVKMHHAIFDFQSKSLYINKINNS